jgi:fluoroquinolone transport system permease protein
MKKYMDMLRYEFKNIIRDRMTLLLLVYPVLIILIGAYLIPTLLDNYASGGGAQTMGITIIIIVFSSIAPFITAAMLGFNLLDHKDENTLNTIRVTPLSLKGYIIFKGFYGYALSVFASFFSLFGVKHLSGDGYTLGGVNLWNSFTWSDMLIYALVAALLTPMFALALGALAKNKIEGFAYMKTSGLFIIAPALSVLTSMQDYKQYILGIVPIFWPVKGLLVSKNILSNPSNLPVILYYLIGILYMSTLTVILYKWFDKKTQT